MRRLPASLIDARQSTCSRCPGCESRTLHWVGNCYFGNPYAPPPMRENSHECKHCDALGDECCDCQGSGKVENDAVCALCKGEGVVLSPGVGWTDWMAIKW